MGIFSAHALLSSRTMFNYLFSLFLLAHTHTRIRVDKGANQFSSRSFNFTFRCAMHLYWLVVVVACTFLRVASSTRCYSGTDRECYLQSSSDACEPGQACQCAKYRFRCTANDTGCDEQEQSMGTIKWAYAFLTKDSCNEMRAATGLYMDVTCCSTDRCNRPAQGKCSWSQERRRATRRLADLLSLD